VWLGRSRAGVRAACRVGSGPRGLGGTDDIAFPYHDAASHSPPARAERMAGRGLGGGAPLLRAIGFTLPDPTSVRERVEPSPSRGGEEERVNRSTRRHGSLDRISGR